MSKLFFLKLFQMLGTRLEELLEQESQNVSSLVTDEARQRQLVLEDEEEDFMDEGNQPTMQSVHWLIINCRN